MTICSICQNPNKSSVDDVLMAGASVRAIAAQFGLSKSAVARHRTGCLAPLVAAAAKIVAPRAVARADVERAKDIVSGKVPASPGDIVSLSGLLDRVARSLERLETAAEGAAAGSLHVPLASLSAQLHRGVETAAKLQGMYTEGPSDGQSGLTVNISLPEGFVPDGGMRDLATRPPAVASPQTDRVDDFDAVEYNQPVDLAATSKSTMSVHINVPGFDALQGKVPTPPARWPPLFSG
jgi:hypothetical protein